MENFYNQIDQEKAEYPAEIMQQITAIALHMTIDVMTSEIALFNSLPWLKKLNYSTDVAGELWFGKLAKFFRDDSNKNAFDAKARFASCLAFWASKSTNTNCKNVADGLRAISFLQGRTTCCNERIEGLMKRITETAISR